MGTFLAQLLPDEMRAAYQYAVHSALCARWGLPHLRDALDRMQQEEVAHMKWLIGRLLELGEEPTLERLAPVRVAADVPEMLEAAASAESWAADAYREGVGIATSHGDEETRRLFERILAMEVAHLDWCRRQDEELRAVGITRYLAHQD